MTSVGDVIEAFRNGPPGYAEAYPLLFGLAEERPGELPVLAHQLLEDLPAGSELTRAVLPWLDVGDLLALADRAVASLARPGRPRDAAAAVVDGVSLQLPGALSKHLPRLWELDEGAYFYSSLGSEAWWSGADLAELNRLSGILAAGSADFRRWYAQVQRMSASPATAAAMARQWYEARRAQRAPEYPEADLLYFVGNADQVLDAIEEFVTGMRPVPSPDRFLGTVLFGDVAGSTQLAAEIGDSRFRDLIDGFHQLVRRQLDRYQGRLVDTAGDGALTLFDSPARAIACAEAVRDGVRALGLQVRAGVHTGEMEHGPGGEVRGIAVHTGARVAALAAPGEILVSRTIRDLVAGAPIRLESRGAHELKSVPGSWEVFTVTS